ncbi:hypothetical protein ACH5RR_022442 [Cinchona calisaya]|uniref:RRM domain-containing protein n=1 Tax=Cinchona calisaya TaxID=153742 RepID=A0ABD2Z7T9_9GENT
MSHFGRTGTTDDDLFSLFDKYGKVVDIFIPRDRSTGELRGFAFVRFKYADEAQKAVDRLDGKLVDGREIAVQFAKYGPNAERIHKGRIIDKVPSSRFWSRSRSPRRRYQNDYHRDRDYRRRCRRRSLDRYESERYRGRERDYHYRNRSRSASPYGRSRGKGHYDDENPGHHRIGGRGRHDAERRRSRSRSFESASPPRHSPSLHRSESPHRIPSPKNGNPDSDTWNDPSPTAQNLSPQGRATDLRSPSPYNFDKV